MGNHSQANSEKKIKEIYKPSRATRLFIVWRKLKKSKLAVAGFSIILFFTMVALLASIIAPNPEQMRSARSPPSMDHLFGTDMVGRDTFSRVVHGTRISLYVGLVSVLIEIIIGVSIGMIAGYFGGIIDEVLMRITDVVLTLPVLMLLIVAVSMFEARSIHTIVLVIGLFGWPFMARVVRSEYLSLRETTYVEAARSMGANSWRIIVRHILPNILSIIIVLGTMDIPWFIFYEATLTFLGFGDPSSPSWGVLLSRGFSHIQSAWWLVTFPGLALLFTSLGFNLFGDGLRDALDVKVRE